MAQLVWITPAGSLGVIPETILYRNTVIAEDPDAGTVTYRVIAGTLPAGVQFSSAGQLAGIPYAVSKDTVNRFTVRATSGNKIADRTFSITVTGNNIPAWVTPAGSIGSFYSSDQVDFQFEWSDNDPDDTVIVTLASGTLPGGLTLSATGKLTGYLQPPPDLTNFPYTQNLNYEFTLEVTDGKSSDLRTFSMFVYNRATLNASTTAITGDNNFVTADETTNSPPFLVNADPSNLGNYRSDNYYAHQFVGESFNNAEITYAISVNQGIGLPPGLTLDPNTGWYYGYITNQGATETTYSFNVTVFNKEFEYETISIIETDSATGNITCTPGGTIALGQPIMLTEDFGGLTAGTIYYVSSIVDNIVIQTPVVGGYPTYQSYCVFQLDGVTLDDQTGSVTTNVLNVCTNTTSGTNIITCFSTADLGVGQPLIFSGTEFGGIVANPDQPQVYYVESIVSETEFTVTTVLGSTTSTNLTTATGTLVANKIIARDPYPFSLTVIGAIDSQVTWITPSDLGYIVNGSTSILNIQAENRGGRSLLYRLKSGAYNLLPQGLELLPTGEIAGRVSFDTFSLDLGQTTFDKSFAVNRNISTLGTTFDLTFTFTVNAYAPDTQETLYKVQAITVVNGGSGYSTLNPPTFAISTPADGATSVQATVGEVTIVGGSVVAVEVAVAGDGYIDVPTITPVEEFGGSGVELLADMVVSGSRDVVSSYKTFTVQVLREYNEPYQNLFVQAMPPQNDRDIINNLLDNPTLFPTDWLYRPDDPNFGLATNVTYAHAYGLAPDILDVYVSALYENHYWKNLVLGSIETAQALDDNGNVIYEVVYSKIIDDLVNNNGESVGKIVNLPYQITDPLTLDPITQVYPNSLINMRTQMIDVVGQISATLPRWMVSKQTNGNVLGYTPAWVIAYTIPGKSKEIAYRISTEFTEQLNQIDFKVDRYILDCELSRNWNYTGEYISGNNPYPGPEGDLLVGPGTWNPQPPTLTTFDRFSTQEITFLSTVDIATRLAYVDVNGRRLSEINALGGLDGVISNINGNTLIFAKQQDYPLLLNCFQTSSGSNTIRCYNATVLSPGQQITFVSGAMGGISPGVIYYVLQVAATDWQTFTITDTPGGILPVTLSNASGTMYANTGEYYPTTNSAWQNYVYPYDSIGFSEAPSEFDEAIVIPGGGQVECFQTYSVGNQIRCNDTSGLQSGQEIVFVINAIGGITLNTVYYILDVVDQTHFTITATAGSMTPVSLSNSTGLMYGDSANERMGIYTITVDPLTSIVTLELTTQTHEYEYVQITRGDYYRSAYLYYPGAPAQGQIRVDWQPVVAVETTQTTFDENSMQFIDPVDMYDPGDTFDKYLVFPKSNILV